MRLLISLSLFFYSTRAQFGDYGEMPDVCEKNSKLTTIMDVMEKCETTSTDCATLSHCIASRLVDMSHCDEGQSTFECNRASASFVLVEQVRRILAASLKGQCTRAVKLQKLRSICDIEARSAGARGGDGADFLVRQISMMLGANDAIADEMNALANRRLRQGIIAIILSFSLPGLLAVFSLTHVRIVTMMQLVAIVMIAVYVYQQHGVLYAIGVVSICITVMLTQFALLLYMAKKHKREEEIHEHTH